MAKSAQSADQELEDLRAQVATLNANLRETAQILRKLSEILTLPGGAR